MAAFPSKSEDTGAFVAQVAFVVAMYAVPGEWIELARPLRLALVTSSLAMGLVFWGFLWRRQLPSLDGFRGFALLGLLILAFLSQAWSVHPEESVRTSWELAKMVAMFFTIINVVTSWKRLQILCAAMVLSSIVTSVGVIHWKQVGENMVEGFRSRWVGVYADPNHMAMDMGIVVPLGIAFLLRKDTSKVMRLFAGIAAGLAVVAMVLSYSRGGFLGLVAGMAVYLLRERHRIQTLWIAGALALGLMIWAPSSFWNRTQTVATFEEDASAMGRVYAWQVAANINKDRPLLGVGLGAFRFAWPLYAPPEARRAYVAHNVFLDVLGELGLIGFIFFLVFVGSTCASTFRTQGIETTGAWLANALSASVVSYLVCDLFSGYLLSSHFYVLMGLAASVERLSVPLVLESSRTHSPMATGGGI